MFIHLEVVGNPSDS